MAVAGIGIFLLMFGNKPLMNNWVKAIGLEWIWAAVILIIFAIILAGSYTFGKRK